MRFDSLLTIGKHYTPWRRFYPMIIATYLYAVWIVTSSVGQGNRDSAGNVVGLDYLMGYTSGIALSEGAADELFNYAAQGERQVEIMGEFEGAAFSLNLPILQWIYVPFAQLPYLWSVAAWSLFGLCLLAASLKLLGRIDVLPLALTFFPVYTNFTFGQNAFVSMVLLCSVWALWSRDKRFLAGVVLALLLYKPQLVTGVGLLWLLNAKRDWPALAGFSVGAAGMAALSFGLMPQAMTDYWSLVQNDIVDLSDVEGFPIYPMQNMRSFFKLLAVPLADPLWVLFALAGIAVFVHAWRRRPGQDNPDHEFNHDFNHAFWFAGAVLLTLWTTPHAVIYDWSLLVVPAVLLWQARPDWHRQLKSLYVLGWLFYFVSMNLSKIQLSVASVAVQISVIFLAFALYTVARLFLDAPTADTTVTAETLRPQPASS